jgi:hypothetical protein
MHKVRFSDDDFQFCLERMPLVSVDICVVKEDCYVAPMLRTKPPTNGFLFTLGGRILKK